MERITNYKPKDFAELLNVSVEQCMKNKIDSIFLIRHVFSCRIYGLRKYKKKIKEDEEIAKSIQEGCILLAIEEEYKIKDKPYTKGFGVFYIEGICSFLKWYS